MENSTIEVNGKKYVVAYDDDRDLRFIPAEKYEAFSDLCFTFTGSSVQLVELREVIFGAGDAWTILRLSEDNPVAEVWKMDESAMQMAEYLDAECDCYFFDTLTSAKSPNYVPDIIKECEEQWSKL